MADETVKKPVDYREVAKQEYLKCSKDPEYFIMKYVYIQMTNGGRGKFNLYLFQKKLLHLLHTKDRLIILKSRQLGITTLCAAYALWLMIFRKDQSILALAPDQDKARSILDKIHFAYDELPNWLLTLANAHAVEKAKLRITLDNGSKAVAASGASKSARGKTATFLVLDEAAFIENAIELWGSAQQTLNTGGSAIMLSTPNGTGNLFYDLYTESELGENEFVPVKLKWQVHPDRDQAWRDRQDKELGSKKMASQECFEANTRVYTKHGLRKISEVKEGDEVLTHLGRFRRVLKTMNHVSSDLISIKSSVNNNSRLVTSNHPFLHNGAWTPIEKIPNKSLLPSFNGTYKLPNTPVVLNVVDVVTPSFFKLIEEDNSVYINDRKHKKRFPKHVTLDYEFGQLIGLYLAEGSKVSNRVTLSFNYQTELDDWVAQISKIVSERYNIEPKISNKKKGSGNLDFCSQILSQIVDTFVDGDYCYHKKLSKFAYDSMSVDMAKGILDGYFKGDGCVLTKYRKVATTVSEDLSYDIIYLFKILGVTGVSTFPTKGGVKIFSSTGSTYYKADKYTVGLSNSINLQCDNRNITTILDKRGKSKPNIEVLEGCNTFNVIHKVKTHCTSTEVYNLEVEEDHTYITEHFIAHNCDAEFLESGDTYLDSEILDWLTANIEEPVEMRGPTKSYWIWKYPRECGNCAVILDTARGDGDPAGIQVIDLLTGDQVAEVKEQLTPKELSALGVLIAKEYNDALLIIENTGLGESTCGYVKDDGYKNVFYAPKGDTLNVQEFLDKYSSKNQEDMNCGFTNSTKTRPIILQAMQQCFLDRLMKVRSKRCVSELRTFIWKNGKPQAANGKHDDLVMPLAIGIFLRDTAVNYQTMGVEMQRAVLGGIKKVTSQDAAMYNLGANQFNNNPYMIQNPYSGEVEDISWVLTGKW